MKQLLNFAILIPLLLLLSATVPRHGAGDPPANGKPIAMTFVDVAKQAGLDFQHFSGSAEKTYILEGMSGGVAWIDYDRDGWQDLYLVNGGHWEELLQGKRSVSNALYRNNGDGTFTDVTDQAGVGGDRWGMGVAASDYDNDGWPDLFVCNYGPNTLYRNNGDGTFTDVTDRAGVGDGRWAVSAAFGDYDADGHLDLYVANTVTFDHKNPPAMNCHYRGMTVQCGPLGLPCDGDILYRNNGQGVFEDVTQKAGVGGVTPSYGLGVVWTDYDNDRDLDLYVANDQMANFMFQNQGDGTFDEVALLSGAGYSDDGVAQGSMGVDFGDYDHDGLLDIFITHFVDDYNTLYRNLGDGNFRDVSHLAEVAFPSWSYLAWGTGFVDFDNDGWEDLFIANGHLFPQVDRYEMGHRYYQRSQLFRNLGNGRFREVMAGLDRVKLWSSRGAAFADYDNDGDVDVAVSNLDGNPWLLRNDGGSRQRWLSLRLEGDRSNRSAVGARVTALTDTGVQIREVRGGSSYQSTNDLRVHFGLGKAKKVKSLEVRWPNGSAQRFTDVSGNRRYRLTEGGRLERDK